MAKPRIGVHSGLVRTVLGPIPVEAMGVTLMHEHILLDASSWWKRPCCGSEIAIAERPLDMSMIGDLRMNPFLNRDNCGLLDVKAAIEELNHFVEYGGKTVVDPTNLGIGRDPSALQRISRRTGLNIVMGAGFYLEPSHPALREGHDDRSDRGGDRAGLRRLGRRARGLRRHHRRDRDQQGLHAVRGESAEGRGARLEAQRRSALHSSSRLGAARPSRARRRRERGRGPASRRALPHEPEPARPQVSAQPGGPGRLHRIRYDRHGLLSTPTSRRSRRATRRTRSPSASWSTTAISIRS